MKTISLQVNDQLAERIKQMSKAELDMLSNMLNAWTTSDSSIWDVMVRNSQLAKARDIIESKLGGWLKGDKE